MVRVFIVLALLALAWGLVLVIPKKTWGELSAKEAVTQLVTSPQMTAQEHGSPWQVLVARAKMRPFNLVPLIIFGCSIVHAFCTGWFRLWGEHIHRRLQIRQRERGGPVDREHTFSFAAEICFFLGEVEVVFALWTIPLVIAISYWYDWHTALAYLNSRDYNEPLFVVVIMTLASTLPILRLAEQILGWVAKLGKNTPAAWWLSLLMIGPLLGSLITEPAAMTITALLLSKKFFFYHPNRRFAYATLGLLFTNVSLGGVLTNFAAPAVLIVSHDWNWTTAHMFMQFGWKAVLTVVIATCGYYFFFRKDLRKLGQIQAGRIWAGPRPETPIPVWLTTVHVAFLLWIVMASHTLIVFAGTFLIFLGFYQATRPHQRPLNLRPPLLVGLFLAGLVIHGGLQGWWIEPLLTGLTQFPLLIIALCLSTVNDNAAITYLSSLAPTFTRGQKYAVMAGAVGGGGLTIIANGPNPAGAQLLGPHFKGGISHAGLFLGALPPTVLAAILFVVLGWSTLIGG
jgi:hypothetical protein